MMIAGAGLAGLIAGHVFPNAMIFEQHEAPKEVHRAVLRFRSDAVSLITGIPFRRVTVRKGVWSGSQFVAPTIALANAYSVKCTGRVLPRSIWAIEPVERFIAPEDLHQQLIGACWQRIFWGAKADDALRDGTPIVSTIPMHTALAAWLPTDTVPSIEFARAPIYVQRWLLDDCDVHQTIYFPDANTSTYRASITGNLLIVESMSELNCLSLMEVQAAFGILDIKSREAGHAKQSYGKIAPIDERLRKEFIHRLSTEADVYSVGRFATWRNILLDDVVKDLRIVKSMIEQNDTYNRKLRSI